MCEKENAVKYDRLLDYREASYLGHLEQHVNKSKNVCKSRNLSDFKLK